MLVLMRARFYWFLMMMLMVQKERVCHCVCCGHEDLQRKAVGDFGNRTMLYSTFIEIKVFCNGLNILHLPSFHRRFGSSTNHIFPGPELPKRAI